jgi:cell wall-associated NlpC family hydrolase
MKLPVKRAITVLILWVLALYASAAQDIETHEIRENVSRDAGQVASQPLTQDDGLAVIAAALDTSVHLRAKRDCSHLVHAIYDRAGFPYSYVGSSDLYVGTSEFRRVERPQPGDLVVWRGHVGIVINPSQHVFFSAMQSGPGIDDFDAPYWRRRGPARFYRYVKRGLVQRRTRSESVSY